MKEKAIHAGTGKISSETNQINAAPLFAVACCDGGAAAGKRADRGLRDGGAESEKARDAHD
jgi:hypothetical protein